MDAHRWSLVSPLLDELLDLDGPQRRTRLAALRDQDAALADELAGLLAAEEDAIGFLAEPPMPVGIASGTRFGAYRLDRLLGEGGMGQVWLAERADGLYERKVALKLLRPGFADQRLRQRFDLEREILARFAHPYIARLLDAGVDPDGHPYLALEYVEGEPITTWCQGRGLDVATRIDLFRQVCEAVSHAHANLIVHRDLKPSNILVTPAGQVRLLDFGIAKLLDVGPMPMEQTRTGVRAFTLHYAAPEQIRGEPVTTMTDVYSLGVVLYELLTGTKPYRLTRGTDAEWEEAILAADPVRPSAAAAAAPPGQTRPLPPARLARELAGDIDNIILKAVAKDPAKRYVSVEALSQDLLNFLRGRPVLARGEGVGYRLRKYLRRHRWAVATTAALLLVMASALAVVAWQAQRALQEAARAQAMQRFVSDLFRDAGQSANMPIDARSLLDLGILRGERALALQPMARAELYGVVAQLRLGLGDYREADELLRRQSALLSTLSGAPAALRLESATLRGDARRQLGDPHACIDQMQPTEPLARSEESRLPQQASAFYSQLGRCRRDQGQPQAAARLFTRAQELRRREGDAAGVAETILDQASLLAARGRPGDALQMISDGIDVLQRKAGADHPLLVDMWRAVCALERSTDDVDNAVRHCKRSLALAQDIFGRRHRATIDASRQLAALYVDLGRLTEAESIFLDTTAWMRARLGDAGPDMARAYNSLGIIAWERGDLRRALRYQQQAVDGWRKGDQTTLTAGGLFNLALILHSEGRSRDALAPLQEALALRRAALGGEHELVGDGERLRAEILAALGDRANAETAARAAVRLTRAGFGPTHSHTRRAEITLARLRAQDGALDARAQLLGFARPLGSALELRKAAWLARAYASELDCRISPASARVALDAVLAEMQVAMPEGGAIVREVGRIRAGCRTAGA